MSEHASGGACGPGERFVRPAGDSGHQVRVEGVGASRHDPGVERGRLRDRIRVGRPARGLCAWGGGGAGQPPPNPCIVRAAGSAATRDRDFDRDSGVWVGPPRPHRSAAGRDHIPALCAGPGLGAGPLTAACGPARLARAGARCSQRASAATERRRGGKNWTSVSRRRVVPAVAGRQTIIHPFSRPAGRWAPRTEEPLRSGRRRQITSAGRRRRRA